jgi:RimJ/RimL family protein N-acetyltransferase
MYWFETERLLLRRFSTSDEAIHSIFYSDPELSRGFSGPKTLEEVRKWLVFRQLEGASDDLGFWAIVRKQDSALLGFGALQYYVPWWLVIEAEQGDPFNRIEVELDCALGRAHWDQGYATEAGDALVEHAFAQLRIPRLVTAVDGDDTRAIDLLRRLGFRLRRNLHPTEGEGAVVGVLENDRVG